MDGSTASDGNVTFIATVGNDNLDRDSKKEALKEAYVDANRTATTENTEVKYEQDRVGNYVYNVYVNGEFADVYTEGSSSVVKAPTLPTPAEQWKAVENDDDPRNEGEWRPLVKSGFLSNDAKFTPTGEFADGLAVIEVSNLTWNTDFDVKVPGFYCVVGGTPSMTIREAYNIQADGKLKGSDNTQADPKVVTGFAIVPVLKANGNITNYIVFHDAAGKFYNAATGAEISGTISDTNAKLKLTDN